MADGPYLLGLDFGTGGARVGIFDPAGTPLVFSERKYTLKHPLAGTNNDALKYNGYGAVSAEWGLPKALWIKEKEPEVYRNARYICDCGDWLIRRLTGEWTSSINTVSSKYEEAIDGADVIMSGVNSFGVRWAGELIFAGRNAGVLEEMAGLFRTPYYHVWTSTDFVGVEVCAAAKNCYALGVGFVEGILDREGDSEALPQL